MCKLVCNFLRCFFFDKIHLLLIVFTTPFQNMFDFRHCNYREEFREQEITGEEQSECSEIKSNFPNGWSVIYSPGRRKIITVNRSNNNHETFEPHTNIYNDRHEEGYVQIPSHFPEPENLWRQYVTAHHQIV